MDLLDNAWITGFTAALLISLVAWRVGALTRSGALAATATGALVVGAGGWWAGVILVAFFATASALSHMPGPVANDVEQQRGNRRDAVQVLADGGLPCLLAVSSGIASNREVWLVAYAAAVAAATSDTWATEVGRMVAAPPRHLLSWTPVPPGTSGAVSGPGTVGAAAGASLIAGLASMGALSGWWDVSGRAPSVLLIVALAGFAGCLADSVLGASVQAISWCPACDQPTEQATHRCGTRTLPLRGVRWMTNDVVNGLAVAFAALAALAVGAAIL